MKQKNKTKTLNFMILTIVILSLMSINLLASMAQPRYAINADLKICSEFFMGDECMTCTIPEGWEFIESFNCPDEYDQVNKESICTPLKNDFCCTAGHSGSSGDCADVVINEIEKKCAFVEDITKCAELPTGWQKANNTDLFGEVCPNFDYTWEETINCTLKTKTNNTNIPLRDNEINNDNVPNSTNIWSGFPLILISTILLTILAVFVLIHNKEKRK